MGTASASAPDRVVFHSTFNRVVAVVIWVLELALLVVNIAVFRELQPLWLIPVTFFALGAWVALWRPEVAVDDAGVSLRNVVRTIRVPWAALIHVDTRFALTLHTPGHRYAAWAAPAPGRTGAVVARRRERRAPTPRLEDLSGEVRPGDLVGSESGEAAYLVRERWQALRTQGRIPAGEAAQHRAHVAVHWLLDAALAALLLGSALVIAYV